MNQPRNTITRRPTPFQQTSLSFALCWWRIELCDFTKAVRFGVMRAGNKRSTHLRAVPSRLHPKTVRLFHFDVSRREILHCVHFQTSAFDRLSNARQGAASARWRAAWAVFVGEHRVCPWRRPATAKRVSPISSKNSFRIAISSHLRAPISQSSSLGVISCRMRCGGNHPARHHATFRGGVVILLWGEPRLIRPPR